MTTEFTLVSGFMKMSKFVKTLKYTQTKNLRLWFPYRSIIHLISIFLYFCNSCSLYSDNK